MPFSWNFSNFDVHISLLRIAFISRRVCLFDRARRCLDPKERKAYLEEACADDVASRERVESLLAAESQVDGFLEWVRSKGVDGFCASLSITCRNAEVRATSRNWQAAFPHSNPAVPSASVLRTSWSRRAALSPASHRIGVAAR